MSINRPRLAIEVLEHAEGLPLPYYATAGSAGLDLLAAVREPVEIPVGDRRLIPTGLRLAIPEGFEGQVRMRSGLALRHGLALPNAPGTIDSDYRGELQVLIVNLGHQPYWVERGVRIAQLVIAPVTQVEIARVESVDATVRGEGGFGHTGVRG